MKYMTVLILTGVILIGCGDETRPPGGSGMMEADESIVSAETTGRVLRQIVQEGQSIRAEDTLVIIDPTTAELQLRTMKASRKSVQAQLRVARVNLDQAQESETYLTSEKQRIARLAGSGTATQQRLDQLSHEAAQASIRSRAARANINAIEAELDKIDAQIAQVEEQLSDRYPLAPRDGVVTDQFIEVGELLTPGKPIAKISRTDTMWVKVYLPTEDFANVAIGDTAVVNTESGGKTYGGRVVWTSEEAEFTPKNIQTKKSRTNLVYAVKVQVPNADGTLKIGMPVYVTIEQ